MEKHRPPRDPSPDYVPKSEIVGALADVLEDQKTKARARNEAAGPQSRQTGPFKVVALLALALVSVYLWFGSPSWLSTEKDNPVSPQLVEAGARMEVYLTALRVEDYRTQEGRLPGSLAEAGAEDSKVEYERLDGQRYRLSLSVPSGVVSYLSTSPLEAFLGDAPQVIGGSR
jgi:hypothetical protein